MVRSKGLEPLRAFTHQLLRLARLPIPPRPQAIILAAAQCTSEMFVSAASGGAGSSCRARRPFEQKRTGPTNADRSLKFHRRFITGFVRSKAALNGRYRAGSTIFARRYPDSRD